MTDELNARKKLLEHALITLESVRDTEPMAEEAIEHYTNQLEEVKKKIEENKKPVDQVIMLKKARIISRVVKKEK